MAQGTQRREGVGDSLAGATQVSPTQRQAPSLSAPNVAVPDLANSMSSKIARSVGQWSSKQFQDAANVKNEAAILDGQMAYQQGKTMEDTEMAGNKWALSGYRIMHAQTLSSSMLAAQQEMITQAQFADDPEKFRAQFVGRMEQQIAGLDPQTARLVRENMSTQMPTLVAQHTQANLKYQEEEAFKALEYNVGTLSKDPTAFGAMLLNAAGGPNSPSGGLSDARRQAAVVAGTVRALGEGNPLAFAQLRANGLFDNLSTSERQSIDAAEQQYQSKLRTTYNKEFQEGEATLMKRIAAGEYTGAASAEAYALLLAKHGMNMTAAEGNDSYTSGTAATDAREGGDVIMIANAQYNGDHKAVAKLTEQFVVHFESGGDPNALSPVGAMGTHQVMPNTATDPGYNIKPANPNDPKDVARVGSDYWALMVSGNKSGYAFNWEAGDVEAAAIAYNAGASNASKWINAGRDYSVLPKRKETEPYAKGILAASKGEGAYETAANRGTRADKILTDLNAAKAADAQVVFQLERIKVDERFEKGDLTDAEYVAEVNALRAQLDIVNSAAQTQHTIATVGKVHDDAQRAIAKASEDLQKQTDAINLEAAKVQAAILEQNYIRDIGTAGLSKLEQLDLQKRFEADTANLYTDAGIPLDKAQPSATTTLALSKLNLAIEADRIAAEKAAVEDKKVKDKNLLETTNGKYQEIKGNFERDINLPGLTDQQRSDITSAFVKGTNDLYTGAGISIGESGYSTKINAAISTLNTANEKAYQDSIDTSRIQYAMKNGTLSELPKALQLKAWDMKNAEINTDVSAAVASGATKEEDAGGVVQDATVTAWIDAGMVDPSVGNAASAALNGTLADSKGVVNPNALAAVELYARVKSEDSIVAYKMLTPEARIIAEGIMSAAGGPGGNLSDGAVRIQQATLARGGLDSPPPTLTDDDHKAVKRATADWIANTDVGLVQAWFSDANTGQIWNRSSEEEDILRSDESTTRISNAIEAEVLRMSKQLNMDPKYMMDQATAGIKGRTEMLGNTLVIMPQGLGIKAQMFGSKAGELDKPDVVNEAVIDYLRTQSALPGNEYIGEYSAWEATGWLGQTVAGAGDRVAGLFGGSVAQPTQGFKGAVNTAMRGVRPFETYTNNSTGEVSVRIVLENGSLGPMVPLPLKTIGNNYYTKYTAELVN